MKNKTKLTLSWLLIGVGALSFFWAFLNPYYYFSLVLAGGICWFIAMFIFPNKKEDGDNGDNTDVKESK